MNSPTSDNPKSNSANKKAQTRAINILSGGIGDYPIRLEIVPKRLVVSIYQQDLVGRGSHIPCWIFVTEGMAAVKQKEFVLAIRIESPEESKKFPKPPLQLFMHLYKAIAQKRRFHIGSVIPLGEKGFMGYAGMGCTHNLINSRDIKLPVSHLTCILLTKEELMTARSLGLTRVLARLGFEQNRFPLNAWNELRRNGIAMKAVMLESQYKRIASLPLEHSSVNLVNGEKVSLVLSPLIHPLIVKFLKEHPQDSKLGFITQMFLYHEGALSWLPAKDVVEMNLHPDSDGELIAGGFIILARDDQSGATMLEDGFMVKLDADALKNIRNAIATKKNFLLEPSGADMAFEVIWNVAGNTDFTSGLQNSDSSETDTAQDEGDSLLGKIKTLFKR